MKIPILQLKNVLLTSIQVDLTDQEALDFQSDVLDMLAQTEAKGLIIDITALDIVDSFLARVINETALMAKLLGAKVVLCGIQPMVALTLVEMGQELVGVQTTLNLDLAMEALQARIEDKGTLL